MARTIAGLATAILLTAAIVSAQAPGPTVDVSGEWELQSSAFLGQVEGLPDCEFSGGAVITQDGGDLGGAATLTLDNGAPECPAEMSADVDGTVTGNTIEMGLLMGGQLGTAQWSGTVDPQGGAEGQGGTGGPFTVDSGPFTGTVGTWSAMRLGEPSVLEIPTLTTIGIVALVALLLGAAAMMLRRRSTPAAPST